MALPLPMLSVLLSTLFVCSLAFRDCKRTRKSVRNSGGTWTELWGCEVEGHLCVCVAACVGEADRLEVRGILCICGETRRCKIKVKKKKSSKINRQADQQTNSRNINVQFNKKKRTNQDHTGRISTQKRPKTTTYWVMTQPCNPSRGGGSFPLFETKSGPLEDLLGNCWRISVQTVSLKTADTVQ